MPVCEDSSIVLDSTFSPSAPATPHVVKRAGRTYGRPRHVEPVDDDSDTSLIHSARSSESRSSIYRTGPLDLNEEIPPSSDPAPSYPDVDHTNEEEEDNTEQDASSGFQFDWKKKLKEMDEQEDFDVDMVGVSHERDAPPPRIEPDDKSALSPQRPAITEELYVPTSSVDGGTDALTEDVFGPPSSNLIASSPPPHRSFGRSPSPKPVPSRRRINRILQDSEDEDDNNKNSSPTSPAFPHPITTPKPESSPTPPTSEDDMSTHARRDAKGKGKEKAAARPNVPPLRFSEALGSASAVKPTKVSSKNIRSKGQKIKAPTKKELAETARDRSRIASDQRIAIPRPEGATHKYSIQNLFQTISSNKPDVDPDPIADFSSDPVTSPAHPYVAPSPPTLRQGDGSPLRPSPKQARKSPLKAIGSLPDLEDDSDTELPEVGVLLAQERQKQDHERFREIKMRLALAQKVKAPTSDSDDDGLEIVQAADMQMVIKEENAERKSGRKKQMSEGRKRQLNLGGFGPAKQKAMEAQGTVSVMQLLKGAGPRKGKKDEGHLTPGGLNKLIVLAVDHQNQQVTRGKVDEWERRGGKIRSGEEGGSSSVQEASRVYAEKGLKLPEGRYIGMDVDLDENDGSDEDWEPGQDIEERGSASPSPQPVDSGDEDDEGGDNQIEYDDADITMVHEEDSTPRTDDEHLVPVKLPSRRSKNKHIVVSDSEGGDDDENCAPASTSSTAGQGRFPTSPLAAQVGHDENAYLPPLPKPILSHRGSLSSMDDPTEDEGDKENENSRMWDRGEDKENKAVVRHRVAGTKPPLGTRKSSLFDLESLPLRGLSMSPGISADTDNDSPGNGNNESRSPFKNLMDDDDLFASPSRSTKFPTSFEARLKQTSPAAPFPSTIPLSLAPFIGAQSLFSKFSEDEPTLAPGPAALEPSFSDLFESGTEKPKGEPSKRPLGGLSVSFSDEPSPHNKLSRTSFAGDLGLTQDVALQPAFHVSGNLLRKADQIFEKEQEYVLEAANKKPQKGSELYVNDHGFLTQTRPDVASPEVYRPPSPTQGIAFNRSSEPQSSDRRPLRTISLADDVEFDSPAPLNRLRKRATTPTSPLLDTGYHPSPSPGPSAPKRLTNAFDVMKRPAKARTDKPKLGRSEFIEQEAQESDDDEMFGFGPGMKNRENEEDGEDLDKTLETLVDDKEMDEETVAAQLVMEKYKEQEDLDDLELEKLHQAAVQGQLRKRRRNRGFGMEDSDDDSDEDEANRRIRRGMHKKQKIDRDNIKELGEHEETKSFYNVYEGDLIAGNEDFTYLQDPQPRDIVMTNQEEDNEEEEPREAITTAEVARLAREYAQEQRDDDEEYLDPHDVSWTDEKYSDEENLHVKSVDLNVRKRPAARRRGLDQADFDVGFEMAPPKQVIAEGSMSRMQSWAKGEGRSRHNGTGRNVGGAAVTGHKAKSGGGSLRSNSAASSASSASSKPSEPRRPVKAQPSLLANVAIERRNMRFG